jgi:GTP-binding protein
MLIKSAEFVESNSDASKCINTPLPEFAFIGRSNVGKSSLINALCNNSKLAKTSSTPGKTQLINHFIINKNWYLVDLPGYGYAKVNKIAKEKFQSIVTHYLEKRDNLRCVFILIDCRLAPQPIDLDFIEWTAQQGIPFIVVFTKTDKLGKVKVAESLTGYQRQLDYLFEELPNIIVTSSEKKVGLTDLSDAIEQIINQK